MSECFLLPLTSCVGNVAGMIMCLYEQINDDDDDNNDELQLGHIVFLCSHGHIF